MNKLLLALLFVSTGCADTSEAIECDLALDRNGRISVNADDLRVAAADVQQDAERLRAQLVSRPSRAGWRGATVRPFAGTQAYGFAKEMQFLRSNVARLKAMELAAINNGDTLLGISHDWQCRTFADSVASLDLGQSISRLSENLDVVSRHAALVERIWREDG